MVDQYVCLSAFFYLHFKRKAEKDLKKVQADVTNKSHHSQFDSKVISYGNYYAPMLIEISIAHHIY